MRVFLAFLFILISSITYAKQDAKIKESEDKIIKNAKEQARLNKQLNELAQDIKTGEKNLASLTTDILALAKKLKALNSQNSIWQKELQDLEKQNKSLVSRKEALERVLIELVAKNFSYELITQEKSQENIISLEALNIVKDLNKSDFKVLSLDYEALIKLMDEKQKQIDLIKNEIQEFQEKNKELDALKVKQAKVLKKQKDDLSVYKKRLEALEESNKSLKQTLEKLKIIQEENAKEEAEKSKTATKTAAKAEELKNTNNKTSPSTYKGEKTISPLKSYTIKQAYGPYHDPIYNKSFFSEGVTIRSKTEDAIVRNILDGKVVFAKEVPGNDTVVVLEHAGDLHTIYAHLSKIPSTVAVGKHVRKNEAIGRVWRDLKFEVTQKNKHINPLEIIAASN